MTTPEIIAVVAYLTVGFVLGTVTADKDGVSPSFSSKSMQEDQHSKDQWHMFTFLTVWPVFILAGLWLILVDVSLALRGRYDE